MGKQDVIVSKYFFQYKGTVEKHNAQSIFGKWIIGFHLPQCSCRKTLSVGLLYLMVLSSIEMSRFVPIFLATCFSLTLGKEGVSEYVLPLDPPNLNLPPPDTASHYKVSRKTFFPGTPTTWFFSTKFQAAGYISDLFSGTHRVRALFAYYHNFGYTVFSCDGICLVSHGISTTIFVRKKLSMFLDNTNKNVFNKKREDSMCSKILTWIR